MKEDFKHTKVGDITEIKAETFIFCAIGNKSHFRQLSKTPSIRRAKAWCKRKLRVYSTRDFVACMRKNGRFKVLVCEPEF